MPEILKPGDPELLFVKGETVPDVLNPKLAKAQPPRVEPSSSKEVILCEATPGRKIYLGGGLPPHFEVQMISFLKARAGTFSWSTHDLVGIDPTVAEHRLNISPRVKTLR